MKTGGGKLGYLGLGLGLGLNMCIPKIVTSSLDVQSSERDDSFSVRIRLD